MVTMNSNKKWVAKKTFVSLNAQEVAMLERLLTDEKLIDSRIGMTNIVQKALREMYERKYPANS